jgi:hypothetical protein
LGEVLGVRSGDQPGPLVPEGELGVPEQGVVGAGDEPAGHRQDGVGGPGPDAGGELLGLLFEGGDERFGHDGLLARRGKSPVSPNYTEVN